MIGVSAESLRGERALTGTGIRRNYVTLRPRRLSRVAAAILVLATLASLTSCDCPEAETPTPVPPTATPTRTPTPEPTPTPTHPLMIEIMRQQSYPGSELEIEEELEPGSNYSRYIASYQSEGLKIFALLTVPQGERPESGWPVIVFNHGYFPPDEYRTTERYVAYLDAFAAAGYIVIRPDYRGHGSSEGEHTTAFGSTDYTVDVLNAMASAQRHPDADPDRVGMWGHSMGGSITLRAMVVSEDIKAGVIWAGVVARYPDLMERWRRRYTEMPTPTPGPDGSSPRWYLWVEPYPSYEEAPDFWESIDPTAHLELLSGPLQLHHGTADETVPVEYSEYLYERLQEMDAVVDLHLYEGDNHNISNNLWTALQRSVQFFDEYVKGGSGG